MREDYVDFSDLTGKVLTAINRDPSKYNKDSDLLEFVCKDGTIYLMYHYQDCCESVYLEDICGDLNDLLETPILSASEDGTSEAIAGLKLYDMAESFTYTFYHLRTIKGTVTLRWFGSSNGYYSESVSFYKLVPSKDN